MTYHELDTLLQGRCYTSRKLANNTYAIRRDDALVIRLHQTDILRFTPDGAVQFNTNGWTTVTTKQRFNEYGPGQVWQHKHEWYWQRANSLSLPTHEYTDGMIVADNGTCNAPLKGDN